MSALQAYLRATKNGHTSVVLVLPLFLLYQVGVLSLGGMKNGADFVTSLLWALLGQSMTAYLAFNVVVLGAFAIGLWLLRAKGHFEARLFPWVLLECTLYALLAGSVVVGVIRAVGLGSLLSMNIVGAGGIAAATAGDAAQWSFVDKVVMSAGAGFYEELVFRFALMGGLFALGTRGLRMHRFAAAAIALVLSSVVFSAVHHVSEPFTISAFTYRIVIGMLFAALYQARGFAVAAYTHFLYDVWVMVF